MAPTSSAPAIKRSLNDRLLAATYLLVAGAPWLFLAGLALLAGRAAQILGHWPVPLADDPGLIAPGDGPYANLGRLSTALRFWLLFSPFLLPGFVVLTWREFRRRTTYALIGLYLLGLVAIRIDPFGLLAWIID
ncbi:MAG TPA: hypothetical protein VD886_08905 [Herpetosiphonaceae bacterium]|nr:hypothetical protein [Herpetosiphonaceae bacterium]